MAKGKELITKGRYELKFRGTKCLNCEHPLDISDKYCPNCSQANSTKRLVLKDFFDEFFSSLVNYDSKLLTTLYALLVKPGTITKDYIKGKRMSYTNPFRFLLSLAFFYFLMFSYNTNFSNLDVYGDKIKGGLKKTGPFSYSFSTSDDENDSIQLQNETKFAQWHLDSLSNTGIPGLKGLKNLNLDSIQAVATQKEIVKDSIIKNHPKTYYKTLEENTGISGYLEKMDFFTERIPEDSLTTVQEAKEIYGFKNSLGNRMAFNSAYSALRVVSQPGTFLNNTFSKLPFVIFFFLPLFAVFIFVVYVRKNYTYTDHLIFSFHNQSLLFILLIVSLIVDSVFGTKSSGLFMLIFAFYLYKAMRKFYGQGRLKTIVKYIFLNTVFTILASITAVLLFTGSMFTY